ncbi:MAG: CBS domain-containing protein [Actinomycetota bacterium]
MSPRAAWRLERLGFDRVYDYAAGKVDWMAAGFPTVRADPAEPRAIEAADRNPPTCGPNDRVLDLPATGGRDLIVVNEQRIVLGRVRATRQHEDATAETIMESGPTTVRAHEPLRPLLERMAKRNVTEMIVSTPEGALLGVVYREDR